MAYINDRIGSKLIETIIEVGLYFLSYWCLRPLPSDITLTGYRRDWSNGKDRF